MPAYLNFLEYARLNCIAGLLADRWKQHHGQSNDLFHKVRGKESQQSDASKAEIYNPNPGGK